MTDYQRGQQDVIDRIRVQLNASVAFGPMNYSTADLLDSLGKLLKTLESEINNPLKETTDAQKTV